VRHLYRGVRHRCIGGLLIGHHGIEGGKAGRVGLIARSSSQFHRLAQLLLGPAEHAHGASGALVLTGGEAMDEKSRTKIPERIGQK
jgi:hypothetical protein